MVEGLVGFEFGRALELDMGELERADVDGHVGTGSTKASFARGLGLGEGEGLVEGFAGLLALVEASEEAGELHPHPAQRGVELDTAAGMLDGSCLVAATDEEVDGVGVPGRARGLGGDACLDRRAYISIPAEIARQGDDLLAGAAGGARLELGSALELRKGAVIIADRIKDHPGRERDHGVLGACSRARSTSARAAAKRRSWAKKQARSRRGKAPGADTIRLVTAES